MKEVYEKFKNSLDGPGNNDSSDILRIQRCRENLRGGGEIVSVVVYHSHDAVRMTIWEQGGNVLGPKCVVVTLWRTCLDLKNSRNGCKSGSG